MKAQTMIGKLFLVFCCISMVLSLAFISNASADENGRPEGTAALLCNDDGGCIVTYIRADDVLIMGMVDCKFVMNANMTKASCNGEGLNLADYDSEVINAVPVELEDCHMKICEGFRCGPTAHGTGQTTLAANYSEDGIPHANLSMTCFFPNDED